MQRPHLLLSSPKTAFLTEQKPPSLFSVSLLCLSIIPVLRSHDNQSVKNQSSESFCLIWSRRMGTRRKTHTFTLSDRASSSSARITHTYTLSNRVSSSAPKPNSSVSARNLRKENLAGVIFGCKNRTMRECLSKKLFGLPALHFPYVRNIKPGMPLFLFNYSERKLYGIFEAACHGKMNIDPFGWSANRSERTLYPAQVRINIRVQCQVLLEDQFCRIIADNYYTPSHFWFELDHEQTSGLISLFTGPSSMINDMPLKDEKLPEEAVVLPEEEEIWINSPYLQSAMAQSDTAGSSKFIDLPLEDEWLLEEPLVPTEVKGEILLNSSDLKSDIAQLVTADPCMDNAMPLDDERLLDEPLASIEKEVDNLINSSNIQSVTAQLVTADPCMDNAMPLDDERLLDEPLASIEKEVDNLINSSNIQSAAAQLVTADPCMDDAMHSDDERLLDEPLASIEKEPVTGSSSTTNEMPLEDEWSIEEMMLSADKNEITVNSSDLQPAISQLIQGLEELKTSSLGQLQRMNALEMKLVESEIQIQQLKDRFKELEFQSDHSMGRIDETVIDHCDESSNNTENDHVLDKDN